MPLNRLFLNRNNLLGRRANLREISDVLKQAAGFDIQIINLLHLFFTIAGQLNYCIVTELNT
jgi:hypothetical protein